MDQPFTVREHQPRLSGRHDRGHVGNPAERQSERLHVRGQRVARRDRVRRAVPVGNVHPRELAGHRNDAREHHAQDPAPLLQPGDRDGHDRGPDVPRRDRQLAHRDVLLFAVPRRSVHPVERLRVRRAREQHLLRLRRPGSDHHDERRHRHRRRDVLPGSPARIEHHVLHRGAGEQLDPDVRVLRLPDRRPDRREDGPRDGSRRRLDHLRDHRDERRSDRRHRRRAGRRPADRPVQRVVRDHLGRNRFRLLDRFLHHRRPRRRGLDRLPDYGRRRPGHDRGPRQRGLCRG